jgi:hypothetical protein
MDRHARRPLISLLTALAVMVGAVGTVALLPATAEAKPKKGSGISGVLKKGVKFKKKKRKNKNGKEEEQEVADALRSTKLIVENLTGSDLQIDSADLDHGDWTKMPPTSIGAGQTESWESASANPSFLTGTEGEVRYRTDDGKPVIIHWSNPLIGKNWHEPDGTDAAFAVNKPNIEDNGKGNNAILELTVTRNN